MQTLVVYDIPHDGVRTKIADICLDYGLERIQYSAYMGDLQRTHQEELLLKVKKKLGKREGKVQLFPICERDMRLVLAVIQVEAAGSPPSPLGSGDSPASLGHDHDHAPTTTTTLRCCTGVRCSTEVYRSPALFRSSVPCRRGPKEPAAGLGSRDSLSKPGSTWQKILCT